MNPNQPSIERLLAFLSRPDLTPEIIDAYFERPGKDIGRVLAQRLIQGRPEGGYTTLKQVLAIKGIGKKRLKLMLDSPYRREGREEMPASLEFRVHASENGLPESFLQHVQRIQIADENSGWQIDLRMGRVAGPEGQPFQIVEEHKALEWKWDYRYETGELLWKEKVSAQVAIFDRSSLEHFNQEDRLGIGLLGDAVRGLSGSDATVKDAQFDLYSGPQREDIRENREVVFLLLQSENLPEVVPLIWYGPWQLESETRSPAFLLRQIQPEDAAPDIPRHDIFFDSGEALSDWLIEPEIVGHGEDRAWDNSSKRRHELRQNFSVARIDAPRIPDLSPVPIRPNNCDPWRRKAIIVNDYGHDQTACNEIASGITGVINASSRNDMIEQLKATTDLENCQCISRLSFYGHGSAGSMSIGDGTEFDVGRVLRQRHIAEFSRHVRPLLCEGATLVFFGCFVGMGNEGSNFLQAMANATGATCLAWTSWVTYRWSYTRDGRIVNFFPDVSGDRVVREPEE